MGRLWGSSLLEDNAEYGLGMVLPINQRRVHLAECALDAVRAGKGRPEVL